jgi:hypothetical protein
MLAPQDIIQLELGYATGVFTHSGLLSEASEESQARKLSKVKLEEIVHP